MCHTTWTIERFWYNVHRFLGSSWEVTIKIVRRSPFLFQWVGLLFCFALAAQDTAGLQARQLYYKTQNAAETEQKNPETKPAVKPRPRPRPKTGAAEGHKEESPKTENKAQPNPLGLKYIIEQEDSSGKLAEVDPDKTFSTGDAIRLRMEVNSDAYVYLLSSGASGEGSFLFPQAGEDNRLRAFQAVQVPAAPADPIRFAEPSGTEILYILVSRTPVPDLDRYLPARGASPPRRPSSATLMAANVPSAEFGEFVGHAEKMESRDLVRGKVVPVSNTASGAANEHAIYAVNVSSTPGAQVLQKLELKHR